MADLSIMSTAMNMEQTGSANIHPGGREREREQGEHPATRCGLTQELLTEVVYECGGDDDPNTTEGVSQNVEEDTYDVMPIVLYGTLMEVMM